MAAFLLLAVGSTAATAAGVVNVSAASFHTAVLSDDGTVRTWGWANTPWGILGTGDNQGGSLRPVDGLPAIAAVDSAFRTSLAIGRDGRVWAWGDNTYGQCGNSAGTNFPSPVQVTSLKNIVQVSCGGINGVAVDQDGDVWVWGDNKYYHIQERRISRGQIHLQ
jgi:alpha-tubulin suppressor-like RCC1 family protein